MLYLVDIQTGEIVNEGDENSLYHIAKTMECCLRNKYVVCNSGLYIDLDIWMTIYEEKAL